MREHQKLMTSVAPTMGRSGRIARSWKNFVKSEAIHFSKDCAY